MNQKLALGVLTCNRLLLLQETLESLFAFNPNISNLVLVDSDSTEEVQAGNRAIASRFGMRYVLNEASPNMEKDARIELGVRRLIKEVLDEGIDICCLLQDDWRCLGCIPVLPAWKFLNTHRNIGQIRLRDFKYDDSFDGGSSVNFVTQRKIDFVDKVKVEDSVFEVGELHWVDSCTLMRRSVLESISKPFDSEMDRMRMFHLEYPANAQLRPGIFHHIGPRRIRKDLREKGFFANANIS